MVELIIPADLRYLSAARVVAATLAAEEGFDVDDLDRLRLGVNELLTILIEAYPPTGRIRICFHTESTDGERRVNVIGDVADGAGEPSGRLDIDELAERILAAVSDRYLLYESGFELSVTVA